MRIASACIYEQQKTGFMVFRWKKNYLTEIMQQKPSYHVHDVWLTFFFFLYFAVKFIIMQHVLFFIIKWLQLILITHFSLKNCHDLISWYILTVKTHSEWKFNIQDWYLLAATMSNVKNKNLFIMISQNLIN